jgi:hypothetical protein
MTEEDIQKMLNIEHGSESSLSDLPNGDELHSLADSERSETSDSLETSDTSSSEYTMRHDIRARACPHLQPVKPTIRLHAL